MTKDQYICTITRETSMDTTSMVLSGGVPVIIYEAARDAQDRIQYNVTPDVFDTMEAAIEAGEKASKSPVYWPRRVRWEVLTDANCLINHKFTKI